MKNRDYCFLVFAAFVLSVFLFPLNSFAKTDLSITATDIVFSKEEPVDGETVRVFARVFNLGDTDVYGFVVFLKDGKEISDPQPVSVKANTYDDVFIDWQAKAGTFNIKAKIINTSLQDENSSNNEAIKENYFIDQDFDKDGIGDKKDTDNDNDGLPDEKEKELGLNPFNPDTDGDRALDGIDPFPLDPEEWQDYDKDGIGDNVDADDDNDGLSDEEELFVFGTSPLNPDSDQDGISDNEEIKFGTNVLLADSDGDGVVDSKDKYPLDPSRGQASILETFRNFIESRGLSFNKFLLIAGSFLVIIFLLRRKRKRKRDD